ncbi:helix-turn-helix domain-containing protein [Kerstersia gyiorum]|uniref:helix-turn-helix domain-containing protein n=1 Tax=Kerstersia gyiorum TaxID=206506 RepID=UPI0021506479|nr:helix-turn-helix domain-containing protein [Kerstersia gyiorum]MCR4160422.1 helix-turn-helix domain-containing protein [Kerstersia gyiorum]
MKDLQYDSKVDERRVALHRKDMTPKEATKIIVWEGCPSVVAAAVHRFEQACTPSYTTASRRYSIWSLVREHMDAPVAETLQALKLPDLLGHSFSRWLELGCERGERVRLERFSKNIRALQRAFKAEFHPGLHALLDTLCEVGFFVLSRKPRISVGVSKERASQAVNYGRRQSSDYPFCELCWKHSMRAVAEEKAKKKTAGKHVPLAEIIRFSSRFCADHNPSDPASRYRVDHRYRQRFQDEVKRQWGQVRRKQAPWAHTPDEWEVRMQAYGLARVPDETRADEMRRMAAQGTPRKTIAEHFGVSRQAVHKALKRV